MSTSASATPQAKASEPPVASPSTEPSPTPRYKLVPYGFESARDRSVMPLLRFEDRAEVRSLEMNAALARFFDPGDDKGNMLRGATPGGAPPLREMAPYRPHVSPSLDLLSLALLGVQEITKQVRNREKDKNGDTPPRLLLAPSPSPTGMPSPLLRPRPPGAGP